MKCSTFCIEEYEYWSVKVKGSAWLTCSVLTIILGSCILFVGSLIGMLKTPQSDPLFNVYTIIFIVSTAITGVIVVTLCSLIIGACCALPK